MLEQGLELEEAVPVPEQAEIFTMLTQMGKNPASLFLCVVSHWVNI